MPVDEIPMEKNSSIWNCVFMSTEGKIDRETGCNAKNEDYVEQGQEMSILSLPVQ